MTVAFELGVSSVRHLFSISVFFFVSLLCQSMASERVVIVGGGLAGLTAAIEASSSGSHVTLIEKEKTIGGNSAKATSGINGAETDFQNKLGIHDEQIWFEKDTLNSGDGLSDQNLVTTLTSNSKSAIEFLHSFGLQLSDVIKLGGHSASRTHRFSPTKEGRPVPVGFTLISTLRKHIEANLANSITVLTQSKFTGLLHQGETVVGVKYLSVDGTERELLGSVILTAGGFANDKSQDSLLNKYAPHVYQLPTTNGPWATGDIIKATANDNLALVHMDKIQVHPTGFLDPKDPQASVKMLAPEALRGCGGLLLNDKGRRFVDELTRRDYVTEAMFQKCNNFELNPSYPVYAVMLLNEAAVQKFGLGAAKFYESRGLLQDVGDLKDVAQLLNIDKTVLELMIGDYKKSSISGKDEFGKTTFPVIFEPEDHFSVAYVTPVVHYCMGGLKIDEKARVLKNVSRGSDGFVPGLFAAGEVTGGIHGQNRLGGNSLLECVVFGRIAGREASNFKQVIHDEV